MIKKFWNLVTSPPTLTPKLCGILTVGGMLLSSVCLTLLVLWIGTLNFSLGRLLYYFGEPGMVLLNYLPVAVLMLLLFLIFNRAWLSFLLTAAVGFLMAFVNHFKVMFRAEPFVAMDLTTLAEGVDAGGEFSYSFPWPFWAGILLIVTGTLLLLRYARGRIPKKRWWIRPILLILCLGFVQFIWDPYYNSEAVYIAFYKQDYSVFDDWKEPERASKRGIIYSFIYSISDLVVQEPSNYDPQMAMDILSQYETELIPKEKQVNVMIHMLESFSDLSDLGIQFRQDPYEQWHELEKESYHGTLITDTLGGGTVNAERSVMTGFTYVHPSYSTPTNSYIRFFSASGYETQATHPGDAWFYNREAVDRRIGFDSTLFEQNYFDQFSGVYHGKDADLYPVLRKLYKEKLSGNKPYFGFHVTYQNHSPYEGGYLQGKEFIPRGELRDETYYTMNNYLAGIEETAVQTAAYVDQFREDTEPVVLVFFGDHKATLGEGNRAYEELGINVSGGSPEGCYNLYSTPYLIWANQAAKDLLGRDFVGQGPVISPCYLMNEIFDCCGWKGPTWLQYQAMVRQSLPVIHRMRTYYVDGVLTGELSKEVNDLRLQRNRVEFYWRYNLTEYS